MLSREVPAAYHPLIAKMRFFIEPEISCSRFFAEACFTDESLEAYRATANRSTLMRTEMGDTLAKRMAGAVFLDIPCGLNAVRDAKRDWDLVPLAQALGASSCWEVDNTADVIGDRVPHVMEVTKGERYTVAHGIKAIGLREEDGFAVATMQDDLLGFLSKLSDAGDRPSFVLYLSGLQPDAALCASAEAQRTIAAPYLMALYDELARICGPKDALILNSAGMLFEGIDETAHPEADPAIALFHRGFTLLRRCKYGKVHLYAKE